MKENFYFIFEIAIKKKGYKLYVKWKICDNSFNSRVSANEIP